MEYREIVAMFVDHDIRRPGFIDQFRVRWPDDTGSNSPDYYLPGSLEWSGEMILVVASGEFINLVRKHGPTYIVLPERELPASFMASWLEVMREAT